MLIPQYQVLVLKLSPIYLVSLNMVFSIPQNQCYPGTPCTSPSRLEVHAGFSDCLRKEKLAKKFYVWEEVDFYIINMC